MLSDDDGLETALRASFTSATSGLGPSTDMTHRVTAARAGRRRVMLRTAIPVLAMAAAAVAVTVGATSASHPARQLAAGQQSSQAVAASERVTVAGHTFALPATFTASTTGCPAPRLGRVSTTLASSGFQDTASSDGGCISIQLVARPPSGGTPVDVGTTDDGQTLDAHLQRSGTELMLTVVAPSAQGSRGLVLASHGLTSDQLLSIARSGFDDLRSSGPTCSGSCG